MKFITYFLTVLVFLSISITKSYADVIYLNNGQTYEGKILKEDEEKIALKTSIMTIILYKKDIKGIERFYPSSGVKMPEGEKFDVSDILKNTNKPKEKKETKLETKDTAESEDTNKEESSKKDYSVDILYLKCKNAYSVPQYGDTPNTFTDIEWDVKSKRLLLNNDYGIYELPVKDGKISFEGAFSAPCPDVKLRAWAYTPENMQVIDILSETIQITKDKKYKYPSDINDPTGLIYVDGFLYLIDRSSSKLFKMQLKDDRVQVVDSYKIASRACGIAYDGQDFYVCQRDTIYRYGKDMNKKAIYYLNVPVEGITFEGSNLWAVAYNKNKVYKFELTK